MRRPESLHDLPEEAPVFALSGALLLPNTRRPLNVFEKRFVKLIDDVLAGNRLVILAQPVDALEEAPTGTVPLHQTGSLGRIVHFEDDGEERYVVVLDGICRVTLEEELHGDAPYRRFHFNADKFKQDFEPEFGEHLVDRERFIDMIKAYADFAQLDFDWEEIEATGTAELVNLSCMLSPYGAREKQVLLEADTLKSRAETLIAMAEMEMARAKSGNVLQ